MQQLLVGRFGEDLRKRWRVNPRDWLNRIAPYELKNKWSY
jgi:hypothetical protein